MEDKRAAAWNADLQIGTRRGPQARGERTAHPRDCVPLPARSTPINGKDSEPSMEDKRAAAWSAGL